MDDENLPTQALDKPHAQTLMAEHSKALKAEVVATSKGKVGQPTKFTQELWDDIMDRLACNENIADICDEPGMPSFYTVRRWWRADPVLKEQVEDAWRDATMFMHYFNDSMLAGGRHSTGDFKRDEARAANNRWFMSKTNRRIFGEKVQVEHTQPQPVILDLGIVNGDGGDGV